MSEADIKDLLGHANSRMTSTYLANTQQRLQDHMKRADALRAAAQAGVSARDAQGDAPGWNVEPATVENARVCL